MVAKKKRRVSLGLAIDAETGEVINNAQRQSRRSHTVLNTSATARRMKKDAEDKKVCLYLIPARWYSSNYMISRFQRSRRSKCVRPRRMSLSHAHWTWRRATSWSIRITFLSRKKRGSGLMRSGQQFPVLSWDGSVVMRRLQFHPRPNAFPVCWNCRVYRFFPILTLKRWWRWRKQLHKSNVGEFKYKISGSSTRR